MQLNTVIALLAFTVYVEFAICQNETPEEMLTVMNEIRGVTFPQADHMTCMTWNPTLATMVTSLANACILPTGTSSVYRVSQTTEIFVEVAAQWLMTGDTSVYDIKSNVCTQPAPNACDPFKIMMNEKVNSVACARASCLPGFIDGCPITAISCEYTVCQFDQSMPSGAPYVVSENNPETSCSSETCAFASDKKKSQCTQFLCCTPPTTSSTTTSLTSSTTSSIKSTSSSTSSTSSTTSSTKSSSSSTSSSSRSSSSTSTTPFSGSTQSSSSTSSTSSTSTTPTTTSSTLGSTLSLTSQSVICDNTGGTWWCARNYAEGRAVTSAILADSCFCVMYRSQSQQQAFASCSAIGGFLTYVQNSQENDLIQNLLNVAQMAQPATSMPCPAGSTPHNGMCYVFQTALKSWQAAEDSCAKTFGGHLASVKSFADQMFLFNILTNRCKTCSIYGFWVGGNNHGSPTNWTWSDGSAMNINNVMLTTNPAWPKQPDNPTSQQCIVLVQYDGGWGDFFCSWALTSVCAFSPKSSMAWIGLQKSTTTSDHYWTIGSNCKTVSAIYQNSDNTAEATTKPAYMYSLTNKMWTAAMSTDTTDIAVCRKDQRICGSPLIQPCTGCTPTNGGQCFTCTSTSTPAPVLVAPVCNPSGVSTNWLCAKDVTQVATIVSAVQADSCFCVMVKNQTLQQAYDSCTTTGGFLTDIQNSDENLLVGALLMMTSSDPTAKSSSCPMPSKFYNGMCYIYHSDEKKSWQAAESYCQQTYKGHLASMHSSADQDFLISLSNGCQGCPVYGFWVGGNNYGVPDNWRWSDNTTNSFMPFTTKQPGWPTQPNNQKSENCMTLCKYDGGWGDWLCYYPEPFVCVFSPGVSAAWIGLQKSGSSHTYTLGSTCTSTIAANYQGWNPSVESPSLSGYVYSSNSAPWTNIDSSTIVPAAVCRMDKNICGRNPCPSCSTCTPTNSGKCFQCTSTAPVVTVAPVTINANPLPTTAASLMCNTMAGQPWKWCAKDYREGQTVTSALQSDSCFCVMNKNQTQQEAFDSCAAIGGFLTDIQNAAENTMLNSLVTSPVSPSSPCPGTSKLFNGMCYAYFSSTPKNWADAEKYCQTTYNGHLPSINNLEVQNFLYTTGSNNCAGCTVLGFWVGGNCHGNPSNWTWSDGTPMLPMGLNVPYLTTHKAWPRQPDDPVNQQCMTVVQPDGGWGDLYCSIAQPFFCAFSPPQNSPWIGLKKIVAGSTWSIGSNCKTTTPTFSNINTAVESPSMTAYSFGTGGMWTNAASTAVSTSAICRMDRNLCGRSPCPSCSTCSLTNNGQCYQCS